MTRAILIAVALIVATLLSACTTYATRDEYASRLDATPVSSGELSEQTFLAIEEDKWLKFELGGDQNVLDFGNGKSFFAAFEIQPSSKLRRLELRSGFNTFAQARGHVVLPTVLVLDSSFDTLLAEESAMRQSSAPDGGTEFAHEIGLGERARYVVVYMDPRNQERIIPWHFSLYVASPMNAGTEGNSRAKVGMGGPMRIRVHTEKE